MIQLRWRAVYRRDKQKCEVRERWGNVTGDLEGGSGLDDSAKVVSPRRGWEKGEFIFIFYFFFAAR